MPWDRNQIATRAVPELEDVMNVNLGIGLPTQRANNVGDKDITLQPENGMLSKGPFPVEGDEDPDLIKAGKQTITRRNRTAYFEYATLFGMIQGGQIAAAILRAMEVAKNDDLTSRMIPAMRVTGMCNEIDLAARVGGVVVVKDHTKKNGDSNSPKECARPLMRKSGFDRIITNRGVLDVIEDGLKIFEGAECVAEQELHYATERTIV